MKATSRFIFYSLSDALIVAKAAENAQKPVEIYSARNGVKSLGPDVFKSILELLKTAHPSAQITAVLDCGQNAGMALSALRRGVRDISVDLPDATREKVVDIATQLTGRVRSYPSDAVDLETIQNPEQSILSLIMEYQEK